MAVFTFYVVSCFLSRQVRVCCQISWPAVAWRVRRRVTSGSRQGNGPWWKEQGGLWMGRDTLRRWQQLFLLVCGFASYGTVRCKKVMQIKLGAASVLTKVLQNHLLPLYRLSAFPFFNSHFLLGTVRLLQVGSNSLHSGFHNTYL